jgi:hypothetical protein
MSSRFDNKRLLYLLAGLILILVLTVIIKIPKEKATIKSKIVELDTSAVSKIILNPKISNGKTVEFNRNNSKWTVRQESIISATQEGAVQNMFTEVLSIKPQSLAAVNKTKWKEFEVTDSLATRIKFIDKKGKILADLMIGKFSYKQADNPYGGYNRNNVQITSFIRVYSEKEVYAVEGLLPFSFNLKFEDWRDKTFIRSRKNDITGIRFTFPADSSYNITRKESVWYVGSQTADSLSVANYLNSLNEINGENIEDNYKPLVNPVYQLLVEGNNLSGFSVKCYKGVGPEEYILNSSLNPEVYFLTTGNGIFKQVFKPQRNFLKQPKKH